MNTEDMTAEGQRVSGRVRHLAAAEAGLRDRQMTISVLELLVCICKSLFFTNKPVDYQRNGRRPLLSPGYIFLPEIWCYCRGCRRVRGRRRSEKSAASTPSCIIKGNRMRFISVCILLRINKDKAKSPSAYFDDGRHNPRDHGFARRSLSLTINNIQPERRQRGRCSCLSLIIRLETLCGGRKAQLIDKEKTPNSPQLHGNIIP